MPSCFDFSVKNKISSHSYFSNMCSGIDMALKRDPNIKEALITVDKDVETIERMKKNFLFNPG